MIRRPPRSTLFPTRRSSDLRRQADDGQDARPDRGDSSAARRRHRLDLVGRSEEHTSELQSQFHLVCRLLLEKKKKTNKKKILKKKKNKENMITYLCHNTIIV